MIDARVSPGNVGTKRSLFKMNEMDVVNARCCTEINGCTY